ncbi:MAG: VCBS repeat-containing protein, partial [Candidatus Thermoplasmatota archaeon]
MNKHSKRISALALKLLIGLAVLMMILSVMPSQGEVYEKSQNGLDEKVDEKMLRSALSKEQTILAGRTAGTGWTEWTTTYDTGDTVFEIIFDNIDNESDNYMEFIYVDVDGVVKVFESDGTANAGPASAVWTVTMASGYSYWQGIATGDADSDGRKEIIVADWLSDVYVYEYSGSGGLSSTNPSTTPVATFDVDATHDDPGAVIVGDQDNDGSKEIIVGFGYATSYGVAVYECTGDNTYTEVWSASDATDDIRCVGVGNNIDGDAYREIVIAGMDYYVRVYECTGDNTYVSRYTLDTTNYVNGLEVYDVDGDGDEEIFAASGSGNLVCIYSTGDNTYAYTNIGLTDPVSDVAARKVSGSSIDGDTYDEVYASRADASATDGGDVLQVEHTGTGLAATDFTVSIVYTSPTGGQACYACCAVYPTFDGDLYTEVFSGNEYNAANPEIYVVECDTPVPNQPPTPTNLGVQGYTSAPDILNITDHTPDLSYTYTDTESDAQFQRNVSVYDSNWNLLWYDNATQSVASGSNVIVTYGGPALSDGSDYYFNVTCNDTGSNTWCTPVSIKFHMNSLPTTTLTAPAHDTWTNDNTPRFEWSYNDPEGSTQNAFNVSIDDDSSFTSINYYNNSTSSNNYWDFSPDNLPDGTWYWHVKTSDGYEWGEWSEWRIIKIDTVLPDTTITDIPAYVNSLASITGTASDSLSGVNKTQIRIYNVTGNTNWTGTGWSNIPAWLDAVGYTTWSYDSSDVKWMDGCSYIIYANATDNATNVNTTPVSDTFGFDTTLPETTIDNIPDYVNSLTSITGMASDSFSGVNKIQIRIYNVTGNTNWTGTGWSNVPVWLDAVGYTTWSYDSSEVKWMDGCSYIIYANATDNATNVNTTPASDTFSYDVTKPESNVIVISPYWQNSTLIIDAEGSDTFSGLKNITLYYYNSTDNSTFYGPWEFGTDADPWVSISWSFNFPKGEGYYRFYSIARDNAT